MEVPRLRFVEQKTLHWGRMADILAMSEAENQWANFGPASRLLERTIERILQVHPDRAVVATSSGTAALMALAGVAAAQLGRPLRWVGSAFGFFSTRIASLAGAVTFVDCDGAGFLDLSRVDDLPDNSWDGLLVTNIFGSDPDLARYSAYCRSRGKALIVDNAVCLLGYQRASPDSPREFISLHHTKPWGFGEGGCAILSREEAPLFRQLIRFGQHAPAGLNMFAGNGKISDLAAAAIVDRLGQHRGWAPQYAAQWHRIADIGRRAGFEVVHELLPGGAVGFTPFLAPHPVPDGLVRTSGLPLAKYYPPLDERPNARALFDRIVCVACHPGMAALSDGRLGEEISLLLTSVDAVR